MNTEQITNMVRRVMGELEVASPKPQAVEEAPVNLQDVTLKIARILSHKVINKAEEIGVKAVTAVVNAGGNPVVAESADGAYIASYDIALNKAYTSVALKMKTSALKELASPDGELYGIQHTNGGRIVIFGGGVPLVYEGRIIGGFGVSGGSAEEDTFLGDYAEEVFNSLNATTNLRKS